jgi:uncharacterized protein
MQPSMFNVRVPLPDRGEVFLMNTFTDAQLLVSTDVVAFLDSLERRDAASASFNPEEQAALEALTTHGFVVDNRAAERARLDEFFHDYRESTNQLRVTVLTTLQCNFACDYCIQGDHGDYNKHAHKMSMETAAELADWAEQRMDALKPSSFVLTFFGGEPLLNLPVMYYLAERLHAAAEARGASQLINVITNGLLLTPEIVAKLKPFGLNGVKITLDGDKDTHDRMRPLRGGQGTFDRIVKNIRAIAGQCRIAIGGNFDADSVDSYPALLDFLKEQDFAGDISKVAFKPIIKPHAPPEPQKPKGFIPLTLVSNQASNKPLGGTCMTAAGAAVNRDAAREKQQHDHQHAQQQKATSACDSCHFADDKMAFLREETRKRGFSTIDGVHMGPCELHRRHAHTIGPDGVLYACPGFAGETSLAVGDIKGHMTPARQHAGQEYERLSPWKACGDCSFMPVCGGGCSVAAHTELGDMHAPNCHKRSFESGVVSLAEQAVLVAAADAAARA